MESDTEDFALEPSDSDEPEEPSVHDDKEENESEIVEDTEEKPVKKRQVKKKKRKDVEQKKIDLSGVNSILSKYIKTEKNLKIFSSVLKNIAINLCKERGIKTYASNAEYTELYTDLVYNSLEIIKNNKLTQAIQILKESHIMWDDTFHRDFKQKQKENDEYTTKPISVEKGIVQCTNCDSHETVSREKQTRSADEPATIFYRCAKCGHNGRIG